MRNERGRPDDFMVVARKVLKKTFANFRCFHVEPLQAVDIGRPINNTMRIKPDFVDFRLEKDR